MLSNINISGQGPGRIIIWLERGRGVDEGFQEIWLRIREFITFSRLGFIGGNYLYCLNFYPPSFCSSHPISGPFLLFPLSFHPSSLHFFYPFIFYSYIFSFFISTFLLSFHPSFLCLFILNPFILSSFIPFSIHYSIFPISFHSSSFIPFSFQSFPFYINLFTN